MTKLSECKHSWEPLPRYMQAGTAARPVANEGCSRRRHLRCVLCSERREVDCQSSRRTRCVYCSERYRKRVRRVASSGLVFLAAGVTYSLTLTAPGRDVHFIRGKVVCPCTPKGGVNLGVWNGRAASNFNRFKQSLERRVKARLEHFRATEPQDRGALHYHVLVRFDRPVVLRRSMVRALAIKHGFGHEIDVQDVLEERRTPAYLSKYVSKSADERRSVPFVHRETGEVGPGRWRTWSSSRRWGESMADVRAAQRKWIAEHRAAIGEGAWPAARPVGAGAGAAGALDPNKAHYTRPVAVCPSLVVGGAM